MSKDVYGHLEEFIEGDDLCQSLYDMHVDRMSVEKLHSKAYIAGELAWRDRIIAGQAKILEAVEKYRKQLNNPDFSREDDFPDW